MYNTASYIMRYSAVNLLVAWAIHQQTRGSAIYDRSNFDELTEMVLRA